VVVYPAIVTSSLHLLFITVDPSHVVILGIPLTFEGIDRGLMGLALVMTICIRRCRRCDEDIHECAMPHVRPFVGKLCGSTGACIHRSTSWIHGP
jgi:hypothetical protein